MSDNVKHCQSGFIRGHLDYTVRVKHKRFSIEHFHSNKLARRVSHGQIGISWGKYGYSSDASIYDTVGRLHFHLVHT